ncbi:hypothetical protein C0992_006341 [Termitomyces sp. T32_za158]|nr:hypothetical protein C0992_006341 [Termitomyces sp. T32_za158]
MWTSVTLQQTPLDMYNTLQDAFRYNVGHVHLLCLYVEAQVQITQTSLSHHTSKLSALHQTTNTISDSLWALLERFPAAPAASPLSPMLALHFPMARLAPLAQGHANIPCSVFPNAYNGNCASGERFLQFCVTYIQLCGNNFLSDKLKIAWVLSYMKSRWAATYATRVFWHPSEVATFADWATFEQEFWDEFFSRNPAQTAALAL